MEHDSNNEAEERDQMLNDKEFIGKVSHWREGRKVDPQ